MTVIETRDCPAFSDWTDVLSKVKSAKAIPRQPGHESADEICKRLGIGYQTFRAMIEAAQDRLEVGQMTIENSRGSPKRVKTYRLKPISASRRRQ